MDGCDLEHDETQAITWNGRQDGGCQGQTGAVAPRCIREHGSILSLMGRGKRAENREGKNKKQKGGREVKRNA